MVTVQYVVAPSSLLSSQLEAAIATISIIIGILIQFFIMTF
jgi:hypothetical protein